MKRLLKPILFILIIMGLFFFTVEMAYRVKVSVSRRNPAFMFYGKNFFESKARNLSNLTHDLIYAREEKAKTEPENAVILAFGGSTTLCTPYVKKKDSWPSRLEYHLDKSLNKNVTVFNMGVKGATCAYNLTGYKNYILENEESPVLVIFYMGINDAATITGDVRDVGHMVKPNFYRIIDWRLRELSLLYAHLKLAYYRISEKNVDQAWKIQRHEVPLTPKFSHFTKDINSAVSIIDDFGSRFLICAVPVSREYWAEQPKQYKAFKDIIAIMEKATQKTNVYFINGDEAIFQRYGDFEKYFVDGIHLDEEGNDKVAQYLANFIVKKNLLGS